MESLTRRGFNMPHILIVDDEKEILDPLKEILVSEGFHVTAFQNPQRALEFLNKNIVDIAIFDIKMPEMSGYELLTQARVKSQNLPVIFLSSKSDEQDQIIGFTLGVDDFVAKPFSKHLLLFRIKSVLKRHTVEIPSAHKPIIIDALKLEIDIDRHLVTWLGKIVSLTVTECMLLISLAGMPGAVKKRQQLMDAAYSDNIYVSDRTIDSHIRNIRRKFEEIHKPCDIIVTVHGLGYKLKV